MVYAVTADMDIDARADFGPNTEWLTLFNNSKDPEIPPPASNPITVFLQTAKRHGAPPDVVYANRTFLVSPASKAIIEGLEPNIHDFVPCEAYYMTGSRYTCHEYFVARLNTFVRDIADMDQCDCLITTTPDGARVWIKKHSKPLAIKAKKIEGKRIFYHRMLFCSDALHDALKAAGLGIGWIFEKQLVV